MTEPPGNWRRGAYEVGMGLMSWAGVCGVLEVGVESVCGVGLVCWAGVCESG